MKQAKREKVEFPSKKKRKNNSVRISFYDELKDTSEISKVKMATLLEFAWEQYKGSKDYYNLIMKETM